MKRLLELTVGAALLGVFVWGGLGFQRWQHQQNLDSALDTAVLRGDMPRVKRCLQKGANVNGAPDRRLVPLHTAATYAWRGPTWIALAEYLLEQGADVNLRDSQGNTALTRVLWSRDAPAAIVNVLLDHGVDLNAQNAEGRTALMQAINSQNEVVARLLVEHGADLNLRDADGNDALRLAYIRAASPELIRLIKERAHRSPNRRQPGSK